ncbi:Lin1244/Lin1753 domain-containing protein [Adlercreutzia sp. ZJ141]|uniref:Lin1244/Lin1753 domain-containing protein n=1 Tax=Adlercreutzia sp. ZJ141 TaxID=2709406 RepID=UPI0013EB162E|nr:Lin1244/Lin1753 domain-containing protein [Adlercreutzia sp. ZJ141]
MPSASDLAAESMAYFPHDSNAASDIKCQRLIIRRGFAGYGRWWRLCEHLASVRGHTIPFETDEDKLILGAVLKFGNGASFDDLLCIEEVTDFVSELLDIGLLQTDKNGCLENPRMHANALSFGKKRAGGHKGGRPRKTKPAQEMPNKQ